MNAIRAQLAVLGIVVAQGKSRFETLWSRIDSGDPAIHPIMRAALLPLLNQWHEAQRANDALEAKLVARARNDEAMRRLMRVPGIGPLTSHAFVAAIGDGRQFSSGREFAAWSGWSPRAHQSANKRGAQHTSRQGDPGVRRPLTLGTSAVMRQVRAKPEKANTWTGGILARRPVTVVVVAQAAKNAGIAWAMLRSGQARRG